METKIAAGIEYKLPEVYLLQETGIGTAEYAARTAYNSFNKSENKEVTYINILTNEQNVGGEVDDFKELLNDIEHSDLLDNLAWVHHHHSVLEHANLTYLIKGISRSVLQEHARHRIQSLTVQSTRYTMSPIINAFAACMPSHNKNEFQNILKNLDFLIVNEKAEYLEINCIWDKLWLQMNELGKDAFLNLALSKGALKTYNMYKDREPGVLLTAIESNKAKKNVGDSFKWIVTDNWKVDMVVTFNLRSLKNYFNLRDSGAAFWQIQELAKAIKKVTPQKYLDLIVKR